MLTAANQHRNTASFSVCFAATETFIKKVTPALHGELRDSAWN